MWSDEPKTICASDVSVLWGKIFLHVMKPGNAAPVLATLDGFEDNQMSENADFRAQVDQFLSQAGKVCIEDNAYMIFPERLWHGHGDQDRQWLYARYGRLLPRLMGRDRKNCYGTYFGRMIGWMGSRQKMREDKNQLEHVISTWNSHRSRNSHPRIADMQVSCFSPLHDLTCQARRGFPCLHQVGFSYDDDGLVISALYPRQYVFDRGYGNFVGLCRLGRFMADQMGVALARMNCFVVAPSLSNRPTKRVWAPLRHAAAALTGGDQQGDPLPARESNG